MDPYVVAVIIVIVIAILFFGYTILKDNSSTGNVVSNYPAQQGYYGGGCGR